MPKVKISEYSATANSNTDVASINIDEGCAPSGINNAIRAIMGHLKDFQQGTNGDPFNGPVGGTANTGAFTTLTSTSASSFATSSGNVGVGTASPAAKLQISVASAGVDGTKGVRIVNPAGTIVMLECGSGGDSFVGTESGSVFNIRTNNAINATFLTSGNVGFGETSPTQKIHFKGSSTTYALAETTGTGTSSGFRMKAGAGTDFTLYTTQGGNQFGIYNNTTSAQPLTINANGALALLGASTSATGAGITFPATQSASTDANTLDDYEEGTWTPVAIGTTTAGTGTYTTQSGSYTKVGRLVTIICEIAWSAHTGTGYVVIGGLPFLNAGLLSVGAVYASNMNFGTLATQLTAFVINSDNNILFRGMINNAGRADTPIDSSIDNLSITLSYQSA